MNLFTHSPLMFTPQELVGGKEYDSHASASAQMWATTHNDTLKEKMSALVNALSACPDKMGTGYLSAFPPELFDCFEAIKPVWAPYYTIDTILMGPVRCLLFVKKLTISDLLEALSVPVDHASDIKEIRERCHINIGTHGFIFSLYTAVGV
ncbi:unnamed protein product [Camellia sinensis]